MPVNCVCPLIVIEYSGMHYFKTNLVRNTFSHIRAGLLAGFPMSRGTHTYIHTYVVISRCRRERLIMFAVHTAHGQEDHLQ